VSRSEEDGEESAEGDVGTMPASRSIGVRTRPARGRGLWWWWWGEDRVGGAVFDGFVIRDCGAVTAMWARSKHAI
jgi:hypothetical protein